MSGGDWYWGRRSRERLVTCDARLVTCADLALAASPFDLTVVFGHRGREEQDRAYREGNSTKQWPNSTHNAYPSRGLDLAPLLSDGSIPWTDQRYWFLLAGLMLAAAAARDVKLRWGGNWDGDEMFDDQRLKDFGHFEVVG